MRFVDSIFCADGWNVAYRRKPCGHILKDTTSPFQIIPNSVRFWAADPIVFEHQGKTYIFAELYEYAKRRGMIGVSELRGDRFTPWKPVIQEPFHMSYPFVFEQEGTVYMLPETSEAKEVILYRAVEFPFKWERCKVIKSDVAWVDTTLFPVETGYLGFTEDDEKKCDLRLLFDRQMNLQSEEILHNRPFGRYRMAGKLFVDGEDHVCVCQDCGEGYGVALFFRYYDAAFQNEERAVRLVAQDLKYDKPLPLYGMHTYSATGGMEVVDVKMRHFNAIDFLFRLLTRVHL